MKIVFIFFTFITMMSFSLFSSQKKVSSSVSQSDRLFLSFTLKTTRA
ncbi:hypothetical protein JXA84_00955 [candidate division WOR-3 bacterium]|nr:hypothetical protein [candidate division WOR-3 bacterium]